MKRILKFVFVYFIFSFNYVCFAQHKVTFLLEQPSLLHSMDNIYVAGNFNLWNPADSNFKFEKSKSGIETIHLLLPDGNYEYKFTRGGWTKVESTSDGKGISNRFFKLSGDTSITIKILGWSDDFAPGISQKKKHSASKHVSIMDSAFFMSELDRTRKIWLYLPPDYSSSKKSYPVLYMHDGQNLFDEATSYSGEWGVDEFLDSIFLKGKKEVIVVGIENGPKRMSEYNPWEFKNFGKGEGDKYVDFLVKNLKPYIDKHYRTFSNKKNTFIAGSSMGGLISLYAVLKYPTVFGGAGIFSPAFWTASGIDSAVIARSKKMNSKLFFYAGGKEGDAMVPDMKRIEKEIRENSVSPVKEIIDPQQKHNETAWRKYFPGFYKWTIENE